MTVDSGNGLVTWALPATGSYLVDLRATNWAGTDLQSIVLDVAPADSDSCGDGTESCSADCPGKTRGKPSSRFCYVEGVCTGSGC